MIFQSDIRRALAHFGQAPFFRYFNRQEAADETIEEIVVAATMLSSQKVGAIIAVEREIGLRNYIESGIPLDATLTYDLLVTIFHPDRRCTTARSSSRRIASPRPRAFCR